MRFFKILLVVLLIFTAGLTPQNKANAQNPEKYTSIRLIADKTQVEAGETITIGIEKKIYPKWHTYWVNPGDSGTALEISYDAPKGFEFGSVQHPLPKKINYGPLTNYGHEGAVTLLQELKLPNTLPNGAISLNATINLLVCEEICIPESHEVSLTLNGSEAPQTDLINQARAKLPTVFEFDGTIAEKNGNLIISVITEDTSAFENLDSITLLPIEWGIINNTTDTKAEITNTGLKLTHKRGERALSDIENFPFVIAYTDPAGEQQGIELSLSTSGSATQSSISFFQALFLAIAGGIILNLMPCVFPVLSMKALSLIQLNDKEEKKARAYGLSYTAGILVSFGLIAGTLIALKAGGAQIGWGFQLQNPLVIIALAYLVFIIGLNLSGLFEFSGRFSHWGQKLTTKSGHSGAFWTGVLATLVATPCTAPFMGAAVGFALTTNAFLAMFVFLGLGFGLALPYLLLCYVPALRQKLPKPGLWMETFRQFLSFPMFITAAWLLWVLTQQADNNTLFFTLLGMIAVVFTLWLSKRNAAKTSASVLKKLFLAIALLGVLSPFLMAQPATTEANPQNKNWESYSPETLSTLLDANDPIFVNMTAAWCITCKVNERIAIKTEKTNKLFEELNVQYLKGDWTNRDPKITAYLKEFNRQGVPLYVFYPGRSSDTGQRPDPVLLPQILTSQIINETIAP